MYPRVLKYSVYPYMIFLRKRRSIILDPIVHTWALCVLVQGVNQGEGWHCNHEDDGSGDDGPDDLHGGVVSQLLRLQHAAVVELGQDLG